MMKEIEQYLKIIRKWWWVIALLLGTTLGTMLIFSFMAEPEYEATVTVQVSAPPPQEVPLYSYFGRSVLSEEIAQTQISFIELLQEGNVAWLALKALPEVPMAGGELRDKITVEIPENSHLMRTSVRAPAPELAAQLANAVVEVGLQEYGRLQAQPTVNTRKFIERELEAARAELRVVEKELAQFQIDNKISTLGQAINRQYDLMEDLQMRSDLARAGGDTAMAQALDEIILVHEAELQNLIGISSEYQELVDRVDQARTTYSFLLDRLAEARIKENQILELSSIQVITPARPPDKPVSAISDKVIILGAVVSFLVGVLLTFLLEYLEIIGVLRRPRRGPESSKITVVSES